MEQEPTDLELKFGALVDALRPDAHKFYQLGQHSTPGTRLRKSLQDIIDAAKAARKEISAIKRGE